MYVHGVHTARSLSAETCPECPTGALTCADARPPGPLAVTAVTAEGPAPRHPAPRSSAVIKPTRSAKCGADGDGWPARRPGRSARRRRLAGPFCHDGRRRLRLSGTAVQRSRPTRSRPYPPPGPVTRLRVAPCVFFLPLRPAASRPRAVRAREHLAVALPEVPQHALVVGRELRVQRRYVDAADRAEPAGPADHRVGRRDGPVHVGPGRAGPVDQRVRRCGRRPLAAQADGRGQSGAARNGRLRDRAHGGAGPARRDLADGPGGGHRCHRHRGRPGVFPAGQRPRPARGRALRDRGGRAGAPGAGSRARRWPA